MSQTNPKVDAFLHRAEAWQEEMELLRTIALDCNLSEELKWGKPCYTFEGNNIAIIQPFKDSCALMFFKGVLLRDPEGVLEAPGANSRIARRIPFTSMQEVHAMEPTLRAYIAEAIEVEEAGLEVELEESDEPEVPEELTRVLEEDPEYQAAFEALTPGRQRAYLLYFSDAKQSKTRAARVERYRQQILEGKGYNER